MLSTTPPTGRACPAFTAAEAEGRASGGGCSQLSDVVPIIQLQVLSPEPVDTASLGRALLLGHYLGLSAGVLSPVTFGQALDLMASIPG